MSANVDAMVREGINAYKTGRKDEARALLLKATELDQYNEQAWLWLSGLMDSADDQRTCLENVLAINPNNERANQGLSYLTGQTSAGNVSPFSASAPPPAPSPSAPTSVEWGAPADPAPDPAAWQRPIHEPSPDVLDDWVNNLNLPITDADVATAFSAPAFESGSSSPFGDFDFNEDDFGDGPFSASPLTVDTPAPAAPPRTSPTPAPRRSPPERRTAPRDTGSLLYDIDSDQDGQFLESGEGEMFGYIPPEIAPTRLPGSRERTPLLLTLSMIVLILLNIGAAVMVALGVLT